MFPTLALSTSVVALSVGTPFFINWLARGNTLYAYVKEGTAKAMMRGDSVDHIEMSLKGYHLNVPGSKWFDSNEPEWQVLKNKPGVNYDNRNFLIHWLGAYHVGLPPFRSVLQYQFSWSELRKSKDPKKQGESEIWDRSEKTDFIYVTSFPYVLTLVEAETADRIPVTIPFQVSVRVVNPYKALFDTENWLELVSGALIAAARNYVGERSYAEMVSEYKSAKGGAITINPFSEPLRKLSEICPDGSPGLNELYGVVIERGDILRVDIAGDNKDAIQTATVEAYTAEQRAFAITTVGTAEATAELAKGTAKADVIRLTGEAEGKSYEAKLNVLSKGGPIAGVLLQTEAMKAPGDGKVYVLANNPLAALPDLARQLGVGGETST